MTQIIDRITELKTDRKPVMLRVDEKKEEGPGFATLFFNHELSFKPGQFIMMWIPDLDEKPFTISFHTKTRFAVTIEAKGIFSKKAVSLEKGDLVGIRGPFGNGFDILSSGNSVVVAGGCGMAPVSPLVEYLPDSTCFIQGAKSKQALLFMDRFRADRKFCTDDGSFGHKGFVTDLLEKEITGPKKIDQVYACGPEIMMYNIFKMCEAHNIPCQVSLERYMRCGFGLCGACVCGDRVVCKDGPVFSSETLRTIKDFNRRALLKSGEPVPLSQYFSWRCT